MATKKVWILERWTTLEDLQSSLNEISAQYDKAVAENADPKIIYALEDAKLVFEREIKENPEGRWYGIDGATIYNQFCDEARMSLIADKDKHNHRVVRADIPKTATQWWGYTNPVENPRILAYLQATKKYYL